MAAIDLRREGDVFVLTMNAGENRFNRPFLNELTAALDEVERSSGPAALVTTGGEEKFYSNGLDLTWLSGEGASEAERLMGYLAWGAGYARIHNGQQYGWVSDLIPQDQIKAEFRRLAAKYDSHN